MKSKVSSNGISHALPATIGGTPIGDAAATKASPMSPERDTMFNRMSAEATVAATIASSRANKSTYSGHNGGPTESTAITSAADEAATSSNHFERVTMDKISAATNHGAPAIASITPEAAGVAGDGQEEDNAKRDGEGVL